MLVSLPTQRGEAVAQSPKEATAPASLPSEVDLRSEFTRYGFEPRNQGKRNTCSVFTTAWAIEFALARHESKAIPLSVEYLNWTANQVIGNRTRDRGQFFHDLLKGYHRYGICPERDMPYADRFDPELQPSEQARKRAESIRAKDLRITWINPWRPKPGLTDEQVRKIKEQLARGWPVAAGSSHSRLLVGYRDDSQQPGGGVFLTKDSGIGRYAEVSYQWAKENIGDVFWVEAAAEE